MPQEQWFYQEAQSIGKPETIGPITRADIIERVASGKLKPKAMVSSPTATKGNWYLANQVPAMQKIFEDIKQQKRQKTEQAKQAKQAKRERQQVEAGEREVRSREISMDTPQKFIASCDLFIDGIRILGRICIVIYGIGMLLGALIQGSVELLIAGIISVMLAYAALEFQILFIRFMRHAIALLQLED